MFNVVACIVANRMVPDALYKYGMDYSELISHDIGSQHLAAVSQLGKTEVKAYRHHSVASTGFIGLAWYKCCRCTLYCTEGTSTSI